MTRFWRRSIASTPRPNTPLSPSALHDSFFESRKRLAFDCRWPLLDSKKALKLSLVQLAFSEAQGPPPRGPPQKSKDLLGAATQATLGLNTSGFEYAVGSPEVYTYIWPWVPFEGNAGLDSLQKEPRARCRCILLGCLPQRSGLGTDPPRNSCLVCPGNVP